MLGPLSDSPRQSALVPLTTQHAEVGVLDATTEAPRRRTGLVRDPQSATRAPNLSGVPPRPPRQAFHEGGGETTAHRLLASAGTRLKPLAPRYLGEAVVTSTIRYLLLITSSAELRTSWISY